MTNSVPNALTAARLVIAPAVVAALVVDAGADGPLRWWAMALFMVGAATDFLDGFLARRWGVVTAFGKLADPIADKVLVLGALAAVTWVDVLPWWPLAVLGVREVAVTVGRLAVAGRGVLPADVGGKLKTALQLLAITALIMPPPWGWFHPAAWWCLVAAVIVAVISGVQVAVGVRRIARAARTADHAR